MDFALNDDDLALREAVQRFCDGEYPAQERGQVETADIAARRYQGLVDLGLLGLQVPGHLGGSELGAVGAGLVAEQLGRALAPGDWLANAVLVAPLLVQRATPDQAGRWLAPLLSGARRFALACHEPGMRHALAEVRTEARQAADGSWVLNGRKTLVLAGAAADGHVIVARCRGRTGERSGLGLFMVAAGAPGLHCRPFDLLDGRGAAQLILQEVAVAPADVLGAPDDAWPAVEAALARAEAVLCAESVGALEALLALTCEHLKTRHQFGVPLARFQALQHRVADMALALEQIKSMACVAAMAVDDPDLGQRDRLVSAAKVLCAQLGRQCGLAAIQLHGAMGMTDECRVGHYAKRLMCNALLFGDAAFHLTRFDQALRPVEPRDAGCPAPMPA